MFQNVGTIDSILRITIGLTLICCAAFGVLPVWGYIGAVPVLTGLIGWCPAYLPLGIKTCGCKE